jgi:soluble lytic murein transglycosylase-like protein
MTPADLKNKTKELEKIKAQLINDLKDRHEDIYKWLHEKGVDLESLGGFSRNISAALILFLGVAAGPVPNHTLVFDIHDSEQAVRTLNSEQMRKLSAEETRALRVWTEYESLIQETAQKYDLDPKIIFATIMVESGGNTQATRYEPHINDSSYGLGQLLSSTARLIGFTGTNQELFDPAVNIDLIGKYHRRNIEAYGELTVDQMATAYNAGSPNSTPTYGHVNKFKKWFNIIGQLFHESYKASTQEVEKITSLGEPV